MTSKNQSSTDQPASADTNSEKDSICEPVQSIRVDGSDLQERLGYEDEEVEHPYIPPAVQDQVAPESIQEVHKSVQPSK
jgi:hypothetical protein